MIEYKNYLHDQGYTELRNEYLEDIKTKVQSRINELEAMSRRKSKTKKELEEKKDQEYLLARMEIYEDVSQVPEDQYKEDKDSIQHK